MSKYQEYISYINNTGGNPSIENFDEDWQPVGEMVRSNLKREGIIIEIDGKIKLTP